MGSIQPACGCPALSCQPLPTQDLAAGPWERVKTNAANGHLPKLLPLSPSFECQPEPGLEALHEAEPGARGLWLHHPICPSLASAICLSACLLSVSAVPLEGLLAGPGSSVPRDFNPSFPPSILPLRSMYHLSLPFLAFIFIFFFLFFLCAPSRGAVTEEKGPATWE